MSEAQIRYHFSWVAWGATVVCAIALLASAAAVAGNHQRANAEVPTVQK